jgi:hypothetical protein
VYITLHYINTKYIQYKSDDNYLNNRIASIENYFQEDDKNISDDIILKQNVTVEKGFINGKLAIVFNENDHYEFISIKNQADKNQVEYVLQDGKVQADIMINSDNELISMRVHK